VDAEMLNDGVGSAVEDATEMLNDGGGASDVDEEEEVMPAMVSAPAKKKKLLVLDVNGLLVATYHKQEALPPEPHHVKLGNFYGNVLLLLFFSIAVVGFLFPFVWKDLCVWFVYSCFVISFQQLVAVQQRW
jgi:hypothetical protein